MCLLTFPLLYLTSATAFDHRACCALFEGYGVSFPGVRMSAVAFRQYTPRAFKRAIPFWFRFRTPFKRHGFRIFLHGAYRTTIVLRKRNVNLLLTATVISIYSYTAVCVYISTYNGMASTFCSHLKLCNR